jgi:hypothetical protein
MEFTLEELEVIEETLEVALRYPGELDNVEKVIEILNRIDRIKHRLDGTC